jgi:hypothetical protein
MNLPADYKQRFPVHVPYAVEFDQREAKAAFKTAAGEMLYQTFANGYSYLVTCEGDIFAVGIQDEAGW